MILVHDLQLHSSNIPLDFTSPPKAYTEDTLLSAMERAGTEDMPEDKVNCSAGAREGGLGHAERKGLGTPATRAAILEKLVQMGFVQRKGKQLVPTKDGTNLAVVLPESLTSPVLTAEWESRLTEIAKGDVAQLAVYDRYSWEYTAFPVGNAVVLIENDRLATALLRLSPKDREIFMMHWFLWMTDEQIAKCMGMARRTVNTRRYKAYRLLKKLMGGEADD